MATSRSKKYAVIIKAFSILCVLFMLLLCAPHNLSADESSNLTIQMNASNGGALPDTLYNFHVTFTTLRPTKSVPITINFDNEGNTLGEYRPKTVTATLNCNGEPLRTATIDVSNSQVRSFGYIFDNLYVNDESGKVNNYTVSLNNTSDIYVVSISDSVATYSLKTCTVTINKNLYQQNNEKELEATLTEVFKVRYGDDFKYTANDTLVHDKADYRLKDGVGNATIKFDAVKEDMSHSFTYVLENRNPQGSRENSQGEDQGGNSQGGNSQKQNNNSTSLAASNESIAVSAEQPLEYIIVVPNSASRSSNRWNLPQATFNAVKSANDSFCELGNGKYSFSLNPSESLTIPDLPEYIVYAITFINCTVEGKPVTLRPGFSIPDNINGTMTESVTVTYNYAPALLDITVFYKDMETRQDIAPADTFKADMYGNATVRAKGIPEYRAIAPDAKIFTGITENETYTFYYIQLESDGIKIVGQVLWEELDAAESRPASIGIELLQNGIIIDIIRISTNYDDHQPFSFGLHPLDDESGQEYVYSVRQIPASIDGYDRAVYSGNQKSGFVITNRQKEKLIIFPPKLDNQGNNVGLVLGNFKDNSNSSLFSLCSAAVGMTTGLFMTGAHISGLSKSSKAKRGAKKSTLRSVLQLSAISIGALQLALVPVVDDFTKPLAVFNSNSPYTLVLFALLAVTIIVYIINSKLSPAPATLFAGQKRGRAKSYRIDSSNVYEVNSLTATCELPLSAFDPLKNEMPLIKLKQASSMSNNDEIYPMSGEKQTLAEAMMKDALKSKNQ